MLNVCPYLIFNDNTQEAFDFYQSVFGGTFSALYPSEDGSGKLMHIALPIGEYTVLMGTDFSETGGETHQAGNNVHISLHPDSFEESKRLFDELSAGGMVDMPFEKQFWGDHYGSFADKFGVRWMVNYSEAGR